MSWFRLSIISLYETGIITLFALRWTLFAMLLFQLVNLRFQQMQDWLFSTKHDTPMAGLLFFCLVSDLDCAEQTVLYISC